MRSSFAALLALALLVGCSDPASSPEAGVAPLAPTLAHIGGPAQPGNSPLLRMDSYIGFSHWDATGTYWAFHTSNAGLCGSDTEFHPVSEQDIISPADEEVLMQIQQGVHNIFVGTYPLDCSTVIAYGTGRIHLTDNDYYSFSNDSRRHNAFGWTAQASLTVLADESTLQYLGRQRCVWDGDDFGSMKCTAALKLH